ncbi:hypothetical protein GCM10009596_12250 [Arthrobacter rhombi]|uniref:outer membrane protein assembly factor BamB family protein n=1 Tax=Arthrobacter rhombi TaxID=71253 RepID=UPI0031DC42A6
MGNRITTSLVSLALLPLALTTACTASPEPPGSSTAPGAEKKAPQTESIAPRSTGKIKPVWTRKLEPIGQPLLQDGVALIISGEGQLMELVALNVKNGKELWRKDYHPGHVPGGLPAVPEISEDRKGRTRVVFLQQGKIPTENAGSYRWTVPVAVDLRTGKLVHRGTTSEQVGSRPRACADGTDLCYMRFKQPDFDSEAVRIDLDTGHSQRGKTVSPLSDQFQPIHRQGLHVVFGEHERFAMVKNKKITWQKDIEKIFGAGASANRGFVVSKVPKKEIYVADLGIPGRSELRNDDSKKHKSKLTDHVLAGIDGATGKTKWKAKGAGTICSFYVGESATRLGDGKAFPIRCDYLSGTYDGVFDHPYAKAKAQLVGYDPLSGKPAWKLKPVKITKRKQMLLETAGDGTYIVTGKSGGHRIVETTHGSSRAALSGETFFCIHSQEIRLPVEPGEDRQRTGTGGDLYASCTSTGKKAKGYTIGAVRDVDNTERGMTLISEEGRVSAFKFPSGQKS